MSDDRLEQIREWAKPRYYDRDGAPLPDVLTWARLMEDDAYRRVEQTETDSALVSTVWLGLDHNYWPLGVPLIFETMVFGGDLDGEITRYPTLQTAQDGHQLMVRRVHDREHVCSPDYACDNPDHWPDV